ncbi:MAG: hypothetical protein H0X63_06975 [Flavobacteriales bacterium]|nr:hypothetical protein [Flavobacteriales bacterium]
MVNFSLHKIGAAFIAALFFFTTYSQNNPKTEFEVFKDYKRLGYTVRPVFYSKATINRKFGDYELINKKTFNFNFGFDYLIHPERKWAFKSGLHLDIVPLYNIEFDIKEGDIWSGYEGYQEDSNIYKLNFAIPLLVQFKKQMAYNLFFNLEMGFHFMIMQQGGFDVTYLFSNEELSESREIFAMYGNATNPTSIYPNLILSPGFYFTFPGILLQTNVIFQKPIVPFFKGEYQFGNLLESGPTRGDYKNSGEYLGLLFTVHLKKKMKHTNNEFDY